MIVLEKLKPLVDRFETVQAEMAAGPDPEAYVRLSREYAELGPVVEHIRALAAATDELAGLSEIIDDASSDAEMRALAEDEYGELEERLEELQHQLKLLLLPKDAADELSGRPAAAERGLRADRPRAAGGDHAARIVVVL